jgi:hypothetical protein
VLLEKGVPRVNTTGAAQVSPFGVQVRPLPAKPELHAHVRAPGVLVHVALTLQPPLLVAHSLTSVQVTPSPVKPVAHVQVREPGVLAHVAFTLQPPLFVAHSFTSSQPSPFVASVYPLPQLQT